MRNEDKLNLAKKDIKSDLNESENQQGNNHVSEQKEDENMRSKGLKVNLIEALKDIKYFGFIIIFILSILFSYFLLEFHFGDLKYGVWYSVFFGVGNTIAIISVLVIDKFFDKTPNDNTTTMIDTDKKIDEMLSKIPSDKLYERVLVQYKLAVQSEQFFEKTMWDIGKLLIPISISAYPIVMLKGEGNEGVAFLLTFILYTAFLLIAKRLRASIRLFRDLAKKLEKKIDGLAYEFVYELEKKAYGNPVKIWTILMILYFVIIDFGIFIFITG